jgi:hypothetical protein
LVYNAVLAAIVLVYFGLNYPASRSLLSVDVLLALFLLAVAANIVYCAAYPIDIFVRSSSYRVQWQKFRWIIFIVGLLSAAVITRFVALGLFQSVSLQRH